MEFLISTSAKVAVGQTTYAKESKILDAKFKPQIKQVTSDIAAAKKAAAKGRKSLEKVVADAEAALKTAQAALARYDAKAGVTKLEKRLVSLESQYKGQIFKLRGKHRMR